jgi:ribosome biogenesis GTPase
MKGTIIKGIGGFYYIKIDKGIIECKARGRF